MDKRAEREFSNVKRDIREKTSNMDMPTATEFMSELADWAYREYENCIVDDEPEDIEED